MRRPPSIARLTAYPAAGGVALLAIGATVATMARGELVYRLTIDSRALHGEPWRFLTSALPHANLLHLAFNVYWLWVFGTLLEEQLGHWRSFGVMALLAAISGAAEYALFIGGIGLSGVGYGLFGLLWMLGRHDPRFSGAIDSRTVQLFLGWGVLCIVTTITGMMPIANVAHAVGLLMGIAIGLAITGRRAAWGALALLSLASLLGASFGRATVNLSRAAAAQSELWVAQQARLAGETDLAVSSALAAVALNPLASSWNFLGRLQEKNDPSAARDSLRRACDLEDSSACVALGTLLELGQGGAADFVGARSLYERGCQRGNQYGCANLARFLEAGTAMPQDLSRAADLYDGACKAGVRESCQSLSELRAYANEGVERTPDAGELGPSR